MMLVSDSVGGADESRNGFSRRRPVNVVPRSTPMATPPLGKRDYIAELVPASDDGEAAPTMTRIGLPRRNATARGIMPRKLAGGLIPAAASKNHPSTPIDKIRKAALDAHIPLIQEAGPSPGARGDDTA